jgi:hypothetical protein
MSISTWKREFYRIPAQNATGKNALSASLKKWIGLRKKNLDKHNVLFCGGDLIDCDGKKFEINDTSCALCQLYYLIGTCNSCPLKLIRNSPCIEKTDIEILSPYDAWCCDQDPEPMIFWLETAIKYKKNICDYVYN